MSAFALAATLTVMNGCFYNSLTRIPLGVAVTVEALGPLALSVVVSRRKTAWMWALLALLGVALLSLTGVRVGHLDTVGLGIAAGAAVSWAGDILATREPAPPPAGDIRDPDLSFAGRGRRRRLAIPGTGGDRRSDGGQHRRGALRARTVGRE